VGVKGAAEVAISEKHRSDCNRFVPMALSGNNLYLAWPNNGTGHWNVFFVGALTAERLYLTISAPNKGNTIDQKMQMSASGSKLLLRGGRTRQELICQYSEHLTHFSTL
jgi:hypothetical protein